MPPTDRDQVMATSCLISNLIELFLFIIILTELIRFNTGPLAAARRNSNKRVRKNVITGLGHFLSWLTEFFLFGFCQIMVIAHRDHRLSPALTNQLNYSD